MYEMMQAKNISVENFKRADEVVVEPNII